MHCWIYKGSQREETYLYLGAEAATDPVPEALLSAMGALELVMELDLSKRQALAIARPQEVMNEIAKRGYYLQLPPLKVPEPGMLQ